eukprot:6214818-Pleurochrysis_carterae.AAC.2
MSCVSTWHRTSYYTRAAEAVTTQELEAFEGGGRAWRRCSLSPCLGGDVSERRRRIKSARELFRRILAPATAVRAWRTSASDRILERQRTAARCEGERSEGADVASAQAAAACSQQLFSGHRAHENLQNLAYLRNGRDDSNPVLCRSTNQRCAAARLRLLRYCSSECRRRGRQAHRCGHVATLFAREKLLIRQRTAAAAVPPVRRSWEPAEDVARTADAAAQLGTRIHRYECRIPSYYLHLAES